MTGHQLALYPFPVAHPARQLSTAAEPADQLDKAQHLVEVVAATLGVMAFGWCRAHALDPGGLQEWHRKLEKGGVDLGTWIAGFQSCAKAMRDWPNDPVATAIKLASSAACPELVRYRPLRNLDAGATAVLESVRPLTNVRLARVRRMARSGTTYLAALDVLTGPHEPFPSHNLSCRSPYEVDSVIAYHDGNLESAVELTPYCVWRQCPKCHREELFYLHQRKKDKDFYFSFSTGHEMVISGSTSRLASKPTVIGATSIGSARAAAASGWRPNWADLAPRPSRIAARLVDASLTASLGLAGAVAADAAGATVLLAATAVGLPLALLYEPAMALAGGTLGKRLLRIEPVSVWDCKRLDKADTLRRALTADAQILFPPLAVRNLAWLLWDPARQCLHDRAGRAIVIRGRSKPGRNL